ncbi:MAG: DUF2779 domain-containing protein [Desulfobacterales bacterium]|jgi:predicted RecB family nuclease
MKPKKVPMLSKSRFLAGLQCPLRLWYQCYERHLAPEISPAQQALFDTGHEIGKLATKLYPKGVLIEEEYFRHAQAVRSTLAAMDNPAVDAIFEAAFVHAGVRIRVDILQKLENSKWNLIEVKSSTGIKDVHLADVAIQYHVLQGSGLSIEQAGVLYLNSLYVYDGSRLDLEQLFSFSDLSEKIFGPLERAPSKLNDFNAMLASDTAPLISPDRHCMDPYPCEFWDHCTRKMPEFWVFGLSGIGQDRLLELAEMAVEDIRSIPEAFPLTEIQKRIRDCVINQEEFFSPGLATELNKIEYPIHFLDFETVAPAVPRYPGTRPFQTIPFQWSDHILKKNGAIDHQEYLCDEDKDPRAEFVRTLLETLRSKGSIFIYTNYEKGIIRSLSEDLPYYGDRFTEILGRIKDLHAILKQHYYHPKFYGSFSLKSILPALLPEMSYEKLSIQEGTQASLEYLRMHDPATPADEKERIKEDLLTYCGCDTLAMVKIRQELLKRYAKAGYNGCQNDVPG